MTRNEIEQASRMRPATALFAINDRLWGDNLAVLDEDAIGVRAITRRPQLRTGFCQWLPDAKDLWNEGEVTLHPTRGGDDITIYAVQHQVRPHEEVHAGGK